MSECHIFLPIFLIYARVRIKLSMVSMCNRCKSMKDVVLVSISPIRDGYW